MINVKESGRRFAGAQFVYRINYEPRRRSLNLPNCAHGFDLHDAAGEFCEAPVSYGPTEFHLALWRSSENPYVGLERFVMGPAGGRWAKNSEAARAGAALSQRLMMITESGACQRSLSARRAGANWGCLPQGARQLSRRRRFRAPHRRSRARGPAAATSGWCSGRPQAGSGRG